MLPRDRQAFRDPTAIGGHHQALGPESAVTGAIRELDAWSKLLVNTGVRRARYNAGVQSGPLFPVSFKHPLRRSIGGNVQVHPDIDGVGPRIVQDEKENVVR